MLEWVEIGGLAPMGPAARLHRGYRSFGAAGIENIGPGLSATTDAHR